MPKTFTLAETLRRLHLKIEAVEKDMVKHLAMHAETKSHETQNEPPQTPPSRPDSYRPIP